MARVATVAVAAVVMTACVNSRVTRFDPHAGADRRTPPDRIRFYQTERPKCAFTELGHVTLSSRFFAPWSKVVRAARQKASDLGGDAVVSVNESTRISGAGISRDGISISETTAISGTVVRFNDPVCRE